MFDGGLQLAEIFISQTREGRARSSLRIQQIRLRLDRRRTPDGVAESARTVLEGSQCDGGIGIANTTFVASKSFRQREVEPLLADEVFNELGVQLAVVRE